MNAKAYVNGELVDLSQEEIQAHLATQETPEATAERAATSAIKSLVASKILAVAPLHTQQNLSSHRIDVMARRMAGEAVSQEDADLEVQAIEVAQRIAAIRKAGSIAIAGSVQPSQIIWPE